MYSTLPESVKVELRARYQEYHVEVMRSQEAAKRARAQAIADTDMDGRRRIVDASQYAFLNLV